jgi:hypothetical protein
MKGDEVTSREFERLLISIDASSKATSESITEIKDYMLHNDYRHAATEAKVEVLKDDVTAILQIMADREPFWGAVKKSKLAIGVLATGALAAAGGGIYNYIVKPDPIINSNKEAQKAKVKPVTKDLIK